MLATGLLLPAFGWGGPAQAAASAPQSQASALKLPATLQPPDDPALRVEHLLYQDYTFQYDVYLPHDYQTRGLSGAVFLLHGVPGSSPWLIESWKALADDKGFVLVEPSLEVQRGGRESLEESTPDILRALAEQVTSAWKLDPHHLYLFGNSSGGVLTFDIALLDGKVFAAAAVHGAAIFPNHDWIVHRATRKTPIAMFIGDHDQFFPLTDAHRTRDLLRGEGIRVDYVEITKHDHDYFTVAPKVMDAAWTFFSQNPLP
jgi:poly(3-hydroxybutyrate) depolymerase